MLPSWAETGMSILAKVLAFWALWKRASLRRVNSSTFFSSWQKTFTTFWPSIISSIKPLRLPRFFCWATKYRPDRPENFLVVKRTTATMARVRRVRGMLSTIIEIKTLTTVMVQLSSWGMLWLIIWRRVSMSLV